MAIIGRAIQIAYRKRRRMTTTTGNGCHLGCSLDGMSEDAGPFETRVTTRRTFLTLMAAAVMPRPQVERLQRRGPAQRVIVVGAGLAGLTGAYELQKVGHAGSVPEAHARARARAGPL